MASRTRTPVLRHPRRAGTPLAGLLLALALAACSDGETDPSSDPSDETTSQTSPATSEPATEPTTPSVQPASGPLLEQDHIQANLPTGWRLDKHQSTSQASGHAPQGFSQMYLSSSPSLVPTVAGLARAVNEVTFDGKGKILKTTVAGVSMAHVKGVYFGSLLEEWVTLVDGDGVITDGVSFTLSFDPEVPAAQRREITDSVLASVVWTD